MLIFSPKSYKIKPGPILKEKMRHFTQLTCVSVRLHNVLYLKLNSYCALNWHIGCHKAIFTLALYFTYYKKENRTTNLLLCITLQLQWNCTLLFFDVDYTFCTSWHWLMLKLFIICLRASCAISFVCQHNICILILTSDTLAKHSVLHFSRPFLPHHY
jgi:hypothetical protein